MTAKKKERLATTLTGVIMCAIFAAGTFESVAVAGICVGIIAACVATLGIVEYRYG